LFNYRLLTETLVLAVVSVGAVLAVNAVLAVVSVGAVLAINAVLAILAVLAGGTILAHRDHLILYL